MKRGEKVCAFIEAYCKIPEGAHVGQPIKLMKFQKQFILDVAVATMRVSADAIVNNRNLSMERFRRMNSWFSIPSSNLIFHFDRVLRNLLQFLVVCLSACVRPKCCLLKN